MTRQSLPEGKTLEDIHVKMPFVRAPDPTGPVTGAVLHP